MTNAHVVEASVTVNNNSPIQDYVHPDDHTQPTYENTDSWVQTFHSCTKMFTKPLTRALRYILIKSYFPEIG